MGSVVFEGVTKRYPNGYVGVDHLDLTIDDGELLVLVGPSGCGKSTALRMVAGLEAISAGTLRIGDRVVNQVSPQDRDIAMVFQNYALFPQMTVAENIGFAMRLRKEPKQNIRAQVERVAAILDLTEYLDRRPGQLSGGQRQRVAMGRAIVRSPQVFLMDEPLSNLDAKLRVQMRSEIARIQRQLGVTTIYVTHDQVEAMTMGDRVAVLRRGVLQQVDAPQDLYDRPSSLFIAQFIGSPPMNIVKVRLDCRGDDLWADLGGGRELKLDPSVLAGRPALAAHVGSEVALGIRAEDIREATQLPGSDPGTHLEVAIELVEALGSEQLVYFELDAPPVRPEATGDETVPIGDRSMVCGRLDPRSRPRVGERATLAVDTARVHVFDLGTGLAIRG